MALIILTKTHYLSTAFCTIFPPSHLCMNKSCERFQWLMLKKSEARQAVLFTMDRGPIPVWSIHLYFQRMQICFSHRITSSCYLIFIIGCKVNYHHNFRVHEGQQIYYDKIPDLVQIGEHQFAERKLINLWIMMMLLLWTSATNCAQVYNMGFTSNDLPDWQFKLQVTSDQVYDAFTILSLLKDCQTQRATLVVPHGGPAKDRFTEAVCARNDRLRLCSQPELQHFCNKCTRFYSGTSLLFSKLVIYTLV